MHLIESNVLPIIFELIRGCNRSLPHMEILRHCMVILESLAQIDKGLHGIVHTPDALDLLVETGENISKQYSNL